MTPVRRLRILFCDLLVVSQWVAPTVKRFRPRKTLGFALAGLTALAACAKPQLLSPAPTDVRATIQRLGLAAPRLTHVVLVEPLTQGSGPGYLRGMGICFSEMFRGPANGEALLLVVPLSILGCPTVGGIFGAVAAPSQTEVAEARTALERVTDGASFSEDLRDEVAALLARHTPQYQLVLLSPDDGVPSVGGPTVETLLVLDDPLVALKPCDLGEHVVPALTLHAAVNAQLLRAGDRSVLHRARVEYWSEDSMPFTAWGANRAERLVLSLAQSQRSLAQQIVQSFFVAETPMEMSWPRCVDQHWRE